MKSRPVLVFNWFLFVYCSGVLTAKWTKRSAEAPSFQQLMNNPPDSFKIAGSECTFTKFDNKQCPIKYMAEGTCNFYSVVSQLFPDVNVEESTNKFIIPNKFGVGRIEVYICPGNPRNGLVSFVAKSTESIELVPQQLTLGAESRLRLSWETLTKFNPGKLEVKLRGFTSMGSDTRVRIEVVKSFDGSDYTLKLKAGSLNVNNFLAKFGIDASQMINSDLTFANSRMGLATLIMQKPVINGLFSPGGGFEVVATGRIAAPELPADASNFYVIVQDFKVGPSDSANEGYDTPIGAILALYRNENIGNLISSLTNFKLPRMAAFKGVDEVAITIATQQLYNINSKTVRDLAKRFVPTEGTDMISKGLTIMHYAPNKNADIKDENQREVQKIYFRIDVTKSGLTWTSPQRIESKMQQLGGFVWSMRGCKNELALAPNTKAVFIDIKYKKKARRMEVSFNLTESVPVLQNGLVSLLDSTITLFSKKKKAGCSWKLRGEGKETILDELVDVTITQSEHRTTVAAAAQIFDMETLMNRTKAKPFNIYYEAAFPFLTKLPLADLRYEAAFEWNNVLKFKGFALVDGKPNVEVVYSIIEGQPQLKLGVIFRNQNLYKVINMFYREDKIKSTWIKFQFICIAIKNTINNGKSMWFDRGCFIEADKSFSNAGIGFIAENMLTAHCIGGEWKMCKFLWAYIGEVIRMKFVGKMLPERMTMSTNQKLHFRLGTGIVFFGSDAVSKIESNKGGDRLSMNANIYLTRTLDMFPATIYDDGTNKIMLKFSPHPIFTNSGSRLLGVNFARMHPIRSTFELPATEHVKVIEFQSRLHIGTVHENQIEFDAGRSREYVWYSAKDKYARVRFVAERIGLKLKYIYAAFGVPDNNPLLKNARFNHQVVVGYTSLDEAWEVPEMGVKVEAGFHFYGKLTLKTGETYVTTLNLRHQRPLQAVMQLDPLRYGKMVSKSQGKPTFHYVNLFLHKDNQRPELGPDLICEGPTQYLKGYAKTVGLEGSFQSEHLSIDGNTFQHQITMRGDLYKEVENVEVTLTANAEDRPKEFEFKYEVDILQQGKSNVNEKLREVLGDIKNQAKKGRDTAKKIANNVKELLDSYKQRSQGYLNEMSSIEDQIHNINRDVDLAMIDVSTDCIDQCKTVAMPGIEWKEDCLQGSGGQRNMNCMTWNADKEKVINVICVLKCEAKKMAAAGEAASNLEEIRVLVNRYRQQKVLHEDVGELIELVEQADEIAKSTKQLIESKTDIQDEVKELLTLSTDLVELNVLRVDTQLQAISPPCLPFHLDFTMKTTQPTSHNGVYPICFNGEFYKNVGLRIMRMQYPAIDEMYKALEEAEFRYARIGGIKKSLSRVEKDIRKASKRDNIPSSPVEDPVEIMLTKIAKRRIPIFTLKGDKTTLSFYHYSPWATVRRSDPFGMEPASARHNMKFNISNFQGKSACHQNREIISEYKDISENLQRWSSNYKHGKFIYGKTKESVLKDLQTSQSEISRLTNRTKLFPAEKRDMLFWYNFAKEGMNEYLQTFGAQLTKQNKRSLSYLNRGLSSFYGTNDFIGHLKNLGNSTVSRSNIGGQSKHKQIIAMAEVGNELQRALSMNLDDAETVITKLKDDVGTLHKSTPLCS